MQLKLTRSQREGGIVSKTVLFCLDARVQFTREEQANVSRYKLGGQLIYNSEASQQRVKAAEAAMSEGTGAGGFKALAQFALARLHLNITVDSLQRGQHIECKSLEELLDAEEALMQACKTLRSYLDTAATFDGREVLVDFNGAESTIVSSAPPPMLAAPRAQIAPAPAPPPSRASAISRIEKPQPAPVRAAQSEARTEPILISPWVEDPVVEAVRRWKTATPEVQVLLIGSGILVLTILYTIL